MRRISLSGVIGTAFLSMSFLSCAQQSPPDQGGQARPQGATTVQIADGKLPKKTTQGAPIGLPQGIIPDVDPALAQAGDKKEPGLFPLGDREIDPQEAALQLNYDAALAQALSLLADRKLTEAFEALETAKTFKDTEFIRNEISKLKMRIDQDAAARKTVSDIETILEKGKAAEASQLAQVALKEFGDSDQADKLVKVKLQADALQAVEKPEEGAVRYERFKNEGEAALKERNLRAAALAFEQALSAREDASLKKQLDDVRAALDRYDELRRKAAELRRDSTNLEEAVAALEEAAKAWDTVQIRQEIDEYSLALQKRRDRVGVADFEVRGDVGIPDAGKTVAEEVLPTLKARFDLVERGQVARVINELKLDGPLVTAENQREVGQVAKIRFLVVGSVSQLGGITVNARLVDVRTGLVVQTAKVVAPNAEELMAILPELGKQLLMGDDEKMVYEAERARQVKALAPPPADVQVTPAPETPVAEQPAPPPIVTDHPVAPDVGGLGIDDFKKLPPAPLDGAPIPAPVFGGEAEVVVKRRLLHVALGVGDNLFRRGRYAEAHRHYELALHLSAGHVDVRVRLERVRPLLPPVVVVEQPVVIVQPARPRIAMLPFVVVGNRLVVPPHLSTWTPANLAPYFAGRYDIVDPGLVYWYMGSMGLSVRDLMENPYARRWLGRALNVRSFVFGTLEETASFFTTTYMVDAEYGYLQASGRIHVRNPRELRLRLGELASLTMMDPVIRARYLAEQQRFDGLLVQAERCIGNRDFVVAIKFYQDALVIRPNHVEAMSRLAFARQRAQELAWEQARAREYAARQAAAAEAQRRQWQLAQTTASVRVKVGNVSIAVTEQRVIEQQRLTAQTTLVREAQLNLKIGNFQLGIRRLESAVAMAPADDALVRQLAIARAEAERAALAEAARANALREAAIRRQKEEELARARKAVADEQNRRLLAEAAARQAQLDRDRVAYQAAFDEGRRLMSNGNYEGAIAAFSAAARVRRTAEVEAQLNAALVENARASATARSAAERQALEAQLAAEKANREKAEAEAKRNQDLYLDALKQAQKAQAARNFIVARAKYQEAGKFFKTDAVLTGLKQVETGQAELLAQAQAAKKKALDEEQKASRIKLLLTEGQAAHAANRFDDALKALRQAKKLAPDNVEVLTALTKAEQAREKAHAETQRQADEKKRQDDFRRLVDSGKANLAAKQYAAAKLALNQALVLKPGDPEAAIALKDVEKGLSSQALDAKAKAEQARKAEIYQKHMDEGRLALSTKRFDDAIGAFGAAQKVLPGDLSSANFLKEAQKGKQDTVAAAAAAAQKRADELKRAADLKKALHDGRTALTAKKLDDAAKAFNTASALAPKDSDVVRALSDLDRARKLVQAETDARQKRQTQYQALLTAGNNALAVKKYADAVKAYNDAVALMPEEKTGQDLLRQAQKAQTDARLLEEKTLQSKLAQEQAVQVQKYLAAGRDALKAKKLDDASKAFADAARIAPKDAEVIRALQDLDIARRGALDQEKTLKLYQDHMAAGQKALNAKKYEDAVKAFQEAAKLFPTDKNAPTLVTQAQRAWDDAKAGDQKALTQKYQALIQSGQNALAAKKYEDAIKAFQEAGKLFPTDKNAPTLVLQAQKAWNDAKTDEKAAVQRYQALIQSGQNALAVKKYEDAIKAFQDAGKLFPTDKNAPALVAKAQKAWDDAKTGDQKALVQKYQAMIQSGQNALAAKKYEDAIKAFQDAGKLFPADKNAPALVAQAQKAWADAKTTQAGEQKRLADFNILLKQGQGALAQKRYAEAKQAFTEALKLFPTDANAQRGQREAQAGLDAGQAAEKVRLADHARFIQQAQAAMQAKRFADAAKAYGDALKIIPTDVTAQRGLQEATRALDASKLKTPPPPQVDKYQKEMDAGAALEKQQKFVEAMKAYEEALKVRPKDQKAGQALKSAEFNWKLDEGQKHLQARRFPEAQREFEAALRIMPGNPIATKLLNQAKKGKK